MTAPQSIALGQHKDYVGSKIGIWMFLITEVVLFGGMFILYAVYRSEHAADFHDAAAELDTLVGTVNTIVLLSSSLTMALSIAGAHHGNRKLAAVMLVLTVLLAAVFMVNKYFEWGSKIGHGIYPGSELLEKLPEGEILFFGLYFTMTGLHGLHVMVGMVLLTVMIFRVLNQPNARVRFADGHGLEAARGGRLAVLDADGTPIWTGEPIDETFQGVAIETRYWPVRSRFKPADFNLLENAGLYWHLVDIIWIFLFPLFYLIT